MNKKLILVGTLALGITVLTLQSCDDSCKNKNGNCTKKSSDGKCGEGKYGDSATSSTKGMDSTKSTEAKCGEGKCGGKK